MVVPVRLKLGAVLVDLGQEQPVQQPEVDRVLVVEVVSPLEPHEERSPLVQTLYAKVDP